MPPNIYDLNLGFKSTIQITIQIMDHSVNEQVKVYYFKCFRYFNVQYLEPKNLNASMSIYTNHLNAQHLNTSK